MADGADVNAKNKYEQTPLHLAAFNGHKEIAELLTDKGADVNAKVDGWTPLHSATTKEVAELLIDNGADVNAKDSVRWTPLHRAAVDGHKEIVELLIAEGADVNAQHDDGGTPLDWAEAEIATLLRKHGGKTGAELKAEGNETTTNNNRSCGAGGVWWPPKIFAKLPDKETSKPSNSTWLMGWM